jgi:[ribosomal protein S5]-alanine N-acetyltransferase
MKMMVGSSRKPARFPPFLPLSTPRLSLVALNLEHASGVFAFAGDAEVSRLVAWPCHEDIEASRRYLASCMIGYARGGYYEWALERRTDQTFIGTCGFGEIDLARSVADINYTVSRPYWGRGYATEAASAVMQFGFVWLGLRMIEANAFPENIASQRVLAKLGMQPTEAAHMSQDSGASRPVCVWRIERERWLVV